MKYLFFIFIIFAAVSAVKKSYNGYKIYKVIPKDDTAVSILEDLRQNGVGEFWNDCITINQDVRVNVSPENRDNFLEFLKLNDIQSEEVISDVQSAIDFQMKPSLSRSSSESYLSFSWNEYHNLDKIYTWLDELQESHPGVVRTVEMGTSVLENTIKGIIINYHPERSEKLIGIIEGTLHAREWICAATVTWIIKEFLTSTDPGIRAMAENFEWHIFPVVNPDGYMYSFTDNRMWRKNRSPANFTTCATNDDMSNGVDLNRNFDFHWGTVGASNDSCTNTFAGPGPFSEPEARAIRDYTLRVNQEGKLIYYLAFHSYTQLIVIPYSHVTSEDSLLSGNYADMYEISIRAADAIEKRYGTQYRVGLSSSIMYPMSGTSFDWVKLATNVPISVLLELRDLGEYGFLLPPDQIIPTALETMDGLIVMDKTTREMGYYRASTAGLYSSVAIIVLGIFVAILG